MRKEVPIARQMLSMWAAFPMQISRSRKSTQMGLTFLFPEMLPAEPTCKRRRPNVRVVPAAAGKAPPPFVGAGWTFRFLCGPHWDAKKRRKVEKSSRRLVLREIRGVLDGGFASRSRHSRAPRMGSSRILLPLSTPVAPPSSVLDKIPTEDASFGNPVEERNGLLGSIPSPVGGTRRERVSRSLSGPKTINNDAVDLEEGEEKDRSKSFRGQKAIKIQNQALLSGLSYCISSCSMILVNKYVLSSYNFNAGISLMLYQNFVSVVLVSILRMTGVISTEPLTWKLVRLWFPVNVIFVGMLITSIFSLKYINVAMVTILKNMTNVITAVGEMYFFKKHHGGKVWASLFLMIVSAVSGGITDLSFHGVGYAWQTLNCFLTASYSLTLRRIMDTAKQVTKSGNLNEFSMVLLNNSLSLPLGLLLVFVFGEVDYLSKTPLLKMPMFWLVITSSGFLGLAISFTSMWFLHQTGATTYSLVGSLNKIPLSLAGIFLFKVPTSLENFLSILFGLLAGVLFARAKIK